MKDKNLFVFLEPKQFEELGKFFFPDSVKLDQSQQKQDVFKNSSYCHLSCRGKTQAVTVHLIIRFLFLILLSAG